MRKSGKIHVGTILVLGLCAVLRAANSPPSLVIVTPGIRDEASNAWVGVASTLAPTKDRWVIRQEGVVGTADLSHVPADHIITLRADTTPYTMRKMLAEVAQHNNATVIVDMDLDGVNPQGLGRLADKVADATNDVVRVPFLQSWDKPTHWAANVAEALADEHLEAHPDSHTMWIGHSAGTEPMTMTPPNVQVKNGDGEMVARPLFNDMYAMSPRRVDTEYPHNTVMVFADGDFLASPNGDIPLGSLTGSFKESDAQAVASLGYPVLRVAGDGSHDAMAVASIDALAGLVVEMKERMDAHTESTNVTYPDRDIFYYAPSATTGIHLPTGSIEHALNAVTAVINAPTADDIAKTLRTEEPTPGLGGISLNAKAYVPVNPAEVESAGYHSNDSALFLRMNNGDTIRFPAMDPEVTAACYQTAYVHGEKAELSIGQAREQDPDGNLVVNPQGPGNFSVYYFGHTQDTLLGEVMYEADSRLGKLAFENPASYRPLPGFRSVAELFPEKYVDNPAQDQWAGADMRVFLNSSAVELQLSPDGQTLEFGNVAFTIHFGQMGPAESAFAGFMETHFNAIAASEAGRPFAQLVPYAKAMAIFRWLKANNIEVQDDELQQITLDKVITPAAQPLGKPPTLDDIAPPRPTVFFGPFGPTRVVRQDGTESSFTYQKGLVSSVQRFDGATFTVYRDSLGAPVGYQWGTQDGAAFIRDAKAGLLYAKGVDFVGTGDDLGVRYRDNTKAYPASNSEDILASVALRFAHGEEMP